MINYLLSLSYDGSNYHGWVIQKKHVTIQSTLNQAIKRVTKSTNFKTLGASKTDAGVHALDQKVLLTCEFKISNLSLFCQALNKALPDDIHVQELKVVGNDFNFHHLVEQKTYWYTINLGPWNLETHRYEWNLPKLKADLDQLQSLADLFVGVHNFQFFSGLKMQETTKINPQREIKSFQVELLDNHLVFKIVGPSFIRYQIRMMIGAIIRVGQNKTPTQNIVDLLNGNRQQKIPFVAPSQGLCLKEIKLKTK